MQEHHAVVDRLLLALHRDGHDFRDYRRDTLQDRIADWLASAQADDVTLFCAAVERDPQRLAALADHLRVSTSLHFRDRELFDALEAVVVPRLVQRSAARPVRAWVAGVATGEEAWSLAMILDAATAGTGVRAELFASDINATALQIARAGRYRAEHAGQIPAHLRRYLIEEEKGETVVIADGLRSRVTFCHHDLLGPSLAPAEAVLAVFDLILCHNVLIYLEDRLQHRLVARLVAQLAPHGVIGLGPVERVPPALADRVEPLAGVPAGLSLFTPRPSP